MGIYYRRRFPRWARTRHPPTRLASRYYSGGRRLCALFGARFGALLDARFGAPRSDRERKSHLHY